MLRKTECVPHACAPLMVSPGKTECATCVCACDGEPGNTVCVPHACAPVMVNSGNTVCATCVYACDGETRKDFVCATCVCA